MRSSLCALRITAMSLCIAAGTAEAQQFPADARVDRLFAQWDKNDSPGCAVGVIRDGRFVYQRGYGMANLDYDIPNAGEMVYYVGSVSKQFTAAAIALLAIDGKISLDDDVRKYFPQMPDYGTPVTVRHMVHHTSGLRDVYGLMSLGGLRMEDVFSDDEAIALIARQKELNFKPGDDYLYSNSGYFLLGQIVKKVSGKSLREFADERIFQPLGMTRTHFHDDPGHIMKRRAMSYEPDQRGGFQISYLQNFDKIGAGGLYSNMDDLRKWDENFYTRKVGGDAFHRMIHTRGVLNKGDTLTYAFGNNVSTYRGLRVTDHGGALMGYKAQLLRFPDQRFTVLETCNLGTIDPGPIAHAIADIYLGDKMGPRTERPVAAQRPPTAPAHNSAMSGDLAALAALAGDYYSEEVDATYRIELGDEGSRLILHSPRNPPRPLVATAPYTFRAGNLTLHFERSSVPAFTIAAGRVRNIRFQKR